MIQQGQVFKLKAKGPDGQPLWAYRYRIEGRGSERPQVGGFATRAEAEKALRKVLDRVGPPAPPRGRSVDAAPCFCRLTRRRKELMSSDEAKPSDGLEPSTPSL
jgi:hypothetical protein